MTEKNKKENNLYSERKKSEFEIFDYSEEEFNILSYEEATIYDIRTYDKYYLSLIKSRHFLISIFYERDDYNINIIKKYLFFFTFAINYSVCILFYNYKTFHKIYEEKGSFNFSYQFPQMLYSSFVTILFYNLL